MDLWVGLQLGHEKMLAKYRHEPPKGELVKNILGRPAELLGISNHLGTQPRIIVPKEFCEALTLHTHEDIHHQNHQKVTHVLKPCITGPAWIETSSTLYQNAKRIEGAQYDAGI